MMWAFYLIHIINKSRSEVIVMAIYSYIAIVTMVKF